MGNGGQWGAVKKHVLCQQGVCGLVMGDVHIYKQISGTYSDLFGRWAPW